MKVLHVLHHSIPYLDGYSIRSRYITELQQKLGITALVLTSAHHEVALRRVNGAGFVPKEAIEGLTYYRTPLMNSALSRFQLGTPFLREYALIRALRTSLKETLSRERVDIVHAHSPVLCGLPAVEIAKEIGIPMVYELRAFWEDSFLQSNYARLARYKHRYSRNLETRVLKRADAVIALSKHMIKDIADRGIDPSRLHYMPNGVDVNHFAPINKDLELIDELQLRDCTVIGFIGSFFQFEGLECLVRAMPNILAKVPRARLVLIGTGEDTDNIRNLIKMLKLDDRVLQLGRVPHGQVLKYYSIMDVLVYPRRRDRMTESVTPLKPLEAMATGRAVVGSNVGGIEELFDNGKVGVLFKAGDSDDLARQLILLLNDPERRAQLAEKARRYVLSERNWERLIPKYLTIYENLLS